MSKTNQEVLNSFKNMVKDNLRIINETGLDDTYGNTVDREVDELFIIIETIGEVTNVTHREMQEYVENKLGIDFEDLVVYASR